MPDLTAQQRNDLAEALTAALPADPCDGTVITGYESAGGSYLATWGHPAELADRLADAVAPLVGRWLDTPVSPDDEAMRLAVLVTGHIYGHTCEACARVREGARP